MFFITGRPEGLRDHTLDQLKEEGYKKGHRLYMRKRDDPDSAAPEKTASRKKITAPATGSS